MKVETKKDKYTAKGNVKYVAKDIIINFDEAVYNKKNGDLKAQGNLKIVIKNKNTDKAKNKVDNGLVINGIGKSYDDRSVLSDVNLS